MARIDPVSPCRVDLEATNGMTTIAMTTTRMMRVGMADALVSSARAILMIATR
ncbi:MAG: hypothetical protein JOZ69_23930 [Myxococcales bacterium]|nr:hypothetical protein [Myxococcales bacterium]